MAVQVFGYANDDPSFRQLTESNRVTAVAANNLYTTAVSSKVNQPLALYLYNQNWQALAALTFHFVATDIVYIENFNRFDRNSKGSGQILLTTAINGWRQQGIKIIYLSPHDNGDGKLYQYYYNLGFRCLNHDQALVLDYRDINSLHFLPTSNYHDFADNFDNNEQYCSLMVLKL